MWLGSGIQQVTDDDYSDLDDFCGGIGAGVGFRAAFSESREMELREQRLT